MLFLLAAALALLQSPSSPAQSVKAFDVASIRPSDPNNPAARGDLLPGGRVIFRNLPMRFLFEFAYSVRHYETSGEPSWFDGRYDIDAIVQGAGEMTDAEAKPPLLALLEDRLKLRVHCETKELPVYDLVVASGGSRLKASTPDEKPSVKWASAGKVTLQKIPLSSLTNLLSSQPEILRPVNDATGLTGEFDFTFQWTPDSSLRSDDSSQVLSIFTALKEQLGLKLIAKKGADEIIVIDHVERPSDN